MIDCLQREKVLQWPYILRDCEIRISDLIKRDEHMLIL